MPTPKRLYRAVRQNPPTAEDFMSYRALDKAGPRRSSEPDGYDGVSTLTTASKARAYARAFNLGEWIATLDVPADAAVFVGPTSANGHVDVRGDPADLLAMVAAVEPVEPPT